jgi:hypothetical protein
MEWCGFNCNRNWGSKSMALSWKTRFWLRLNYKIARRSIRKSIKAQRRKFRDMRKRLGVPHRIKTKRKRKDKTQKDKGRRKPRKKTAKSKASAGAFGVLSEDGM